MLGNHGKLIADAFSGTAKITITAKTNIVANRFIKAKILRICLYDVKGMEVFFTPYLTKDFLLNW